MRAREAGAALKRKRPPTHVNFQFLLRLPVRKGDFLSDKLAVEVIENWIDTGELPFGAEIERMDWKIQEGAAFRQGSYDTAECEEWRDRFIRRFRGNISAKLIRPDKRASEPIEDLGEDEDDWEPF